MRTKYMKIIPKLSLIIIHGPAGVGKTTRASLLRDNLSNTAHIGVDHIKRFISEFREVSSHLEVSKKVVRSMANEYLNNGISVIVEQGMASVEIKSFKEIADLNSANFFVYRLDAPRHVLNERVEERTERLGKPKIPQEEIDAHYKIHLENDYPNTREFDTQKIDAKTFVRIVEEDLRAV